MVALVVLVLSHQEGTKKAFTMDDLEKLGTARKTFEKLVVETKSDYELNDHIYGMPLGQHVDGLYPFHASDRRILVTLGFGGGGVYYQQIVRGRARRLWALPLRDLAVGEKPQFKGTLALHLHGMGYAAARQVTKHQQKVLEAIKPFAGYGFAGPEGSDMEAWTLRPDGTTTTVYCLDRYLNRSTPFFPIVPEEALTFKLAAWPETVNWTVEAERARELERSRKAAIEEFEKGRKEAERQALTSDPRATTSKPLAALESSSNERAGPDRARTRERLVQG